MTTNSTPPGAEPIRSGGHVPPSGGPDPSWDAVFTPLTPQDPRQISGYLLRARIGEGGMGAVYLSYTPGGRPVALKVARPEFAADPEFRRRFASEVKIAQRVQGLYTAPVIDCDPHASQPWLATAYVAAPSLAAAVSRQGPLPPESVLVLIAGIAEALQSIHAAGVIHRDLKPGNVILAADGPRVIDFGISRAVEASSVAITQTGVRIGTPAFMAPEQVQGKSLGPAGDVFSLGSTAYYAVTGELPFGADAAVFHRIEHQQPDWERCPDPVRGVLEQCVEKEPAARPMPAALIELCRVASTDERLRIGEGWLPPTVTAELTRYSIVPPEPPPTPTPPGPPRRDRSPWLIGGLGAAALVVMIVLLVALSNRSSDQTDGIRTTTDTSTRGTFTSRGTSPSSGTSTTGTGTPSGEPTTTAGTGNPTSKPTVAEAGTGDPVPGPSQAPASRPAPAPEQPAPATTRPPPDPDGGTSSQLVYHGAGGEAGWIWFNSGTANLEKGRNSFTVKDLACGDAWSIYVQYAFRDSQGNPQEGSRYLSGDCDPVEWSGSVAGPQPEIISFRWRGCKWDTNYQSADTCEPWMTSTLR